MVRALVLLAHLPAELALLLRRLERALLRVPHHLRLRIARLLLALLLRAHLRRVVEPAPADAARRRLLHHRPLLRARRLRITPARRFHHRSIRAGEPALPPLLHLRKRGVLCILPLLRAHELLLGRGLDVVPVALIPRRVRRVGLRLDAAA